MNSILQRLAAGDILFCDGAMGTFLQAKGLQPGQCPESWCVERAADVQDIHRQYKQGGSDIVETNSFGGSPYKLKHYDLADRCAELNRAAAAIAKEVAGDEQFVLASCGPTGEFLYPLGLAKEEEMIEALAIQMKAFAEGGADAVIVETQSALEEATCAVRAAKDNTDLEVIVSFSFEPQANGGFATMMGVQPQQMAEAMLAAGADILGTNCSTGPDHMIDIVKAIAQVSGDTPIMAMPNAGMPEIENGQTVFRQTPADMAAKAPLLVEAGAKIIGGCCGTTPQHIAAMKQAVVG